MKQLNTDMMTLNTKPTIPEVIPVLKAWYAKTGNTCGGIFHIILEDSNHEQVWAIKALEQARVTGDVEAIHIAELLAAMSPTQRLKLSKMTLY